MPKLWMNLRGPARMVAICATVLLVASGMLGVEAGLTIVLGSGLLTFLGPSPDVLIKPFVILGYLEICAIFFSLLGIIAGFIGMIFHRPYRYISDKIYFFRARHAREVSNEYIYFEDAHPAQTNNPREPGWRD